MKEKKTLFKIVSPDIRKLAIPLISLIGIFFCIFIVGKVGFNKITSQKIEIEKTEKNIIILSQKQEILLKVEETLSSDIKFFSLALPDSNPSLSVIYQIKTFSLENGVFFEDIKSGGESKLQNYSKVDLKFDLTGDLNGILSFLKLTETFAPIVTVEKLELSQSSGTHKGSIALKGYWAPFPEKIPAVTQPIGDFTEDELKIITKISNLSVPQFSSVYPQEPTSRENPFE